MVKAEVSLVAFSVNPVTNVRDEVVINANFGLGESLVTGQITPDTFIVSKNNWNISRHIANKKQIATGGVEGIEYVDISTALSQHSSLTDEQIVEIAQLTIIAAHSGFRAYPFLGKPPQPAEEIKDRFSGPHLPLQSEPGKLQGIGASAGLARGPARVVKTLDEALSLKAGEILVCPATNPTWTPLFGIAAALVTERGGSLSHAAVVAREYRLPAVVGTHFATVQIHSGQMVEVDGERGIVTLFN